MIILFRFSLFSVCGSSSTGNLRSISAFVGIIAHKMRSAKINYWSENIFQKKAHEITRLINKRQSWRFESEMSAETCWGWELERWSPKDTWAEFYFAFRTNLRSEFMTTFMYISTEVRTEGAMYLQGICLPFRSHHVDGDEKRLRKHAEY